MPIIFNNKHKKEWELMYRCVIYLSCMMWWLVWNIVYFRIIYTKRGNKLGFSCRSIVLIPQVISNIHPVGKFYISDLLIINISLNIASGYTVRIIK